jgi:hypothetical protein
MPHYKDRKSAKAIEHDFPHFVEMVVPEGGLGSKLKAMYDFHIQHGISAQRGHGQRLENGRSVIRWCFADPAIAAMFAKEFRGLTMRFQQPQNRLPHTQGRLRNVI